MVIGSVADDDEVENAVSLLWLGQAGANCKQISKRIKPFLLLNVTVVVLPDPGIKIALLFVEQLDL